MMSQVCRCTNAYTNALVSSNDILFCPSRHCVSAKVYNAKFTDFLIPKITNKGSGWCVVSENSLLVGRVASTIFQSSIGTPEEK